MDEDAKRAFLTRYAAKASPQPGALQPLPAGPDGAVAGLVRIGVVYGPPPIGAMRGLPIAPCAPAKDPSNPLKRDD